jgi:hypothetical protein
VFSISKIAIKKVVIEGKTKRLVREIEKVKISNTNILRKPE